MQTNRLSDMAVHRFVAEVCAKGHDLRLIERRRGVWSRLYDLELRDGRVATWRQVLAALRTAA